MYSLVYRHDSFPLRHASFKVFLEKYLESRNMDSMVYGSKVLFAGVGKRKLTMNRKLTMCCAKVDQKACKCALLLLLVG